MRAVCDVKGCDYVANHARQAYANAMLGRHKRFTHGIAGKSPTALSSARKASTRNSESLQPVATEEQQQLRIPNFCPECGCNMQAIVAALNLRRRR